MNITVLRHTFTTQATGSTVSINGEPSCFAIEDVDRKLENGGVKVPKLTAIPRGNFVLTLRTEGAMHQRYKERFQWHRGMLWLQDVPDFKWVYFHVGNSAAESEGCVLLVSTLDLTQQGGLFGTGSVSAYDKFYCRVCASLARGEKVVVSVR